VIGLDISKATIERLSEIFPDHNFIVGDIRSTGFDDESFDAYFSWGTFEHFEIGLGPCFKEANRILKKGGYLFVSVPFQNGRHLRKDRRELYMWDENFDRENGYVKEIRFY
jgi:ubiquinone/menaquinone biosynthesis C-methylase UbiE